jgi:ABC-type bacteriocin/lantibiotic exporter with double-glycine peptidase domain
MSLRRIVGATSQVIDFLSMPVDQTMQGSLEGPASVQEVRLRDLRFSYSPEQPLIEGADMVFTKGEIVGIVGTSGAGKSTLGDLILRLRSPNDGTIFIDGMDLSELRERWLRSAMGFVDQEPFLFNGTIRENLLLANPKSSETELIEALKAASAADFVAGLPKGIDTLVGEGGGLLSVGQKQRIALARALIKKPMILLLDEITSSLDTENEQIILDALKMLAPSMVIILISHRKLVTDYCHRVYSLSDGFATQL